MNKFSQYKYKTKDKFSVSDDQSWINGYICPVFVLCSCCFRCLHEDVFLKDVDKYLTSHISDFFKKLNTLFKTSVSIVCVCSVQD